MSDTNNPSRPAPGYAPNPQHAHPAQGQQPYPGQPQQYGQQPHGGQPQQYGQQPPTAQPQQYGQQLPTAQPQHFSQQPPTAQPQQYGQQPHGGQPQQYGQQPHGGQPQQYGQQLPTAQPQHFSQQPPTAQPQQYGQQPPTAQPQQYGQHPQGQQPQQHGQQPQAQQRHQAPAQAAPGYPAPPAQPSFQASAAPAAGAGFASAAAAAGAGFASAAPRRSTVPGCLHGYPLTIREAGFISAMKLSFKVFPYALFRFLQGALFSTISAVLLGIIITLTAVLTMYVHQYAGAGVFVVAILAWVMLWLPFAERKVFGAKCGHIAVLTELITNGQIGNGGESMFAYGKRLVDTRIGSLDTVWDVYNAIRRSVRKLTRVLNFADDLLPFDISALKRAIHRIVDWASPYVTAVVISYGLARGDEDFAEAGMDGLCYSVQNAKSVFKSAIGAVITGTLLMLPTWLFALAAFIPGMFLLTLTIMGGDVAAVQVDAFAYAKAAPIPFLSAVVAGLLLGYLFAWLTAKTIKESFVNPIMITMVMLKFHVATENQALDPSWKQRVMGADDGLGKLSRASRQIGGALG